MSDSYRTIWTELGIDLETHDALLTVLGNAYRDIHLSQKNRPKGMAYFDLVMSEVHDPRIEDVAGRKKSGPQDHRHLLRVPEEIVLAANATLVVLCSGADSSIDIIGPIINRLTAEKDVQISSMCTVFAESEVTSLIAKGQDRREIAQGAAHQRHPAGRGYDQPGICRRGYRIYRRCCQKPMHDGSSCGKTGPKGAYPG